MKRVALGCIVLLSLVSTGCREDRSLVGKWQSTGIRPATITFNSDGTARFELKIRGRQIEVGGNYQEDQNRVNITQISMDQSGLQGLEGVGAAIANELIPKETTLEISWKGPDEIVVNGNLIASGGYKRVKN